jgi:chorismate mutase
MNTKTMATMEVQLPLTWKYSSPLANVFIMVRYTYPSDRCVLFTHHGAGKFVSESKFQENPAAFIPHILQRNRAALEGLITKPEVERKLLHRLQKKAATYAQDFAPDGEFKRDAEGNVDVTGKIDVDGVVDLYESFIIPLTKEVEVSEFTFSFNFVNAVTLQVDYLLHRLSGLSEEDIEKLKQKK